MKAEFRRPLPNRERNEADFVAVKMLRGICCLNICVNLMDTVSIK